MKFSERFSDSWQTEFFPDFLKPSRVGFQPEVQTIGIEPVFVGEFDHFAFVLIPGRRVCYCLLAFSDHGDMWFVLGGIVVQVLGELRDIVSRQFFINKGYCPVGVVSNCGCRCVHGFL